MDTAVQHRTKEFIASLRGLASLVGEHRRAIDVDRQLPKPLFDAWILKPSEFYSR